MYVEVAKIQAVLDKSAAQKMEKDLSSRFARVAKRFGSGITTALRRGLLVSGAGAIAGFAAMLLNPLREAEDVLNRVLGRGASATDIAAELGTDVGKYLRLETAAQMKGASPEDLQVLLRRYQSAIAAEREAEARGEAPGTLRQFTSEKDMAVSFLNFVKSLQSAENKDRAVVVLDEIFGRRDRWKSSAFLNADFAELLTPLPSAEQFGQAANRANTFQGEIDFMQGIEGAKAFIQQTNAVPDNIVEIQRKTFQEQAKKEANSLRQFEILRDAQNNLAETANELRELGTQFLRDYGPELIETTRDFTQGVKALAPVIEGAAKAMGSGFSSVVEATADLSVKHEGMIRWLLKNHPVAHAYSAFQYLRRKID